MNFSHLDTCCCCCICVPISRRTISLHTHIRFQHKHTQLQRNIEALTHTRKHAFSPNITNSSTYNTYIPIDIMTLQLFFHPFADESARVLFLASHPKIGYDSKSFPLCVCAHYKHIFTNTHQYS